MQILIPNVISTPRDVKRLTGTYHVLASMVSGEVDWVDLLGLSALYVKAPGTADRIRAEPERIVENPLSSEYQILQMVEEDKGKKAHLQRFVPEVEHTEAIADLLAWLFPSFSDRLERTPEVPDAVRFRRPLLTVLRLGLIPNEVSREDVARFLAKGSGSMLSELVSLFESGAIEPFLDRLEDVYEEEIDGRHGGFWLAVSDFLRKPDNEWMTSYSPMRGIAHEIAGTFNRLMGRSDEFRKVAPKIFKELLNRNDITLVSMLLRAEISEYGIYGSRRSHSGQNILSEEATQELAKRLSQGYREHHLADRWLAELWDLAPVFTMIDTGAWDDECRTRVTSLLVEDGAVDALVLLMFGHIYNIDLTVVGQILEVAPFARKVEERLKKEIQLHPSVKHALTRASAVVPTEDAAASIESAK